MKPTLLQIVENILQTLSMLLQLAGRLMDVKILVSGSAAVKNVQKTPTSSVSSSVYSVSVSRITVDITLLANNPVFTPDQVSFFGLSLPVSDFHVIILDTLFH